MALCIAQVCEKLDRMITSAEQLKIIHLLHFKQGTVYCNSIFSNHQNSMNDDMDDDNNDIYMYRYVNAHYSAHKYDLHICIKILNGI